jgi:phenylalanyl-tRNA synthetase alpha chain
MENLDNEKILTEAKDEASSCKDMPSLMNSKAKYLGKKGPLTSLFAQMKNIPNEEKKAFGQRINEIKEKLAFIFDEQKKLIEERKLNERLEKETIDVTLPGHSYGKGSEHPFEKVVKKIEDFFVGYGYEVKDGPEVETDYFNFECLNIPKDHPARDMQDSFFISEGMLLRSHTSPVQARVMQGK